jgi:hypothetical protein
MELAKTEEHEKNDAMGPTQNVINITTDRHLLFDSFSRRCVLHDALGVSCRRRAVARGKNYMSHDAAKPRKLRLVADATHGGV